MNAAANTASAPPRSVAGLSRLGWAVGAVALLTYLLTLHRGVLGWDSAELVTGVYTQGIVHSTGYPLYLLLARLWALLPLGEFALRVNLFSAFMGALTVALLADSALRLSGKPLAAGGAALLYGWANAIWPLALGAEVYTLHTALIAGSMNLLLRPPSRPAVMGAFLLLGAALANHLAALLLLPTLLLYLGWRVRRVNPLLVGGLLLALAALLPYAYVPIRATASDFHLLVPYFSRDLTQPADVLWYVSGGMFRGLMFDYTPPGFVGQLAAFLGQWSLNFLGVGLLLGAMGVAALWRERRALTAALLAGFAAQVLFFAGYSAFDKWTMFHTAYLLWALFVAGGIATLSEQFPRRMVIAGIGLLLAVQCVVNGVFLGQLDGQAAERRADTFFAQLPQNALAVGQWTTIRPLEYRQLVGGVRHDVATLDVTLLELGLTDQFPAMDETAIQARLLAVLREQIRCAERPVYWLGEAVSLGDGFQVRPVAAEVFAVLPDAIPCDEGGA